MIIKFLNIVSKLFIFIIFLFGITFPQFSENTTDKTLEPLISDVNNSVLAGTLKVVFIEYSYPDIQVSVAQYTDRNNPDGKWYKALGVYPDGTTLQEKIENNGPIDVADFLAEAVTHYFETISHANVWVEFNTPRNPHISSGIWYTDKNRSHYTNYSDVHKSIMDSVYNEYPALISNANCIVFFSTQTTKEIYPATYSKYGNLKLSDNTTVYTGPYAFGRVFHWPQNPSLISHEIAHRIEKSLHPSSPIGLSISDRGTDVYANVYRSGYPTLYVHNTVETYDLMYHTGNLTTENSLYGQIPLSSYDLIRFGWIASDEILEIRPSTTSSIVNIRLSDMRKQLTSQQKTNKYYRIVKIYLNENFNSDQDEYFLLEYHKGTDYDKHLYNYDEGVCKGLLVWQIAETSNPGNPAMDIITAVPYNGFYDHPLPNDSYPKTWEIYSYPSNWSGLVKNNEYDWLNDHMHALDDFGSSSYAPNGGRHVYEVLNTDSANWYRTNSKKDDFFTDESIKGRVNDKILPTTRPSTRNFWGEHTKIGIINVSIKTDHLEFDFYNNYWTGTISEDQNISGKIDIHDDLIIETGTTVNIEEGTILTFNENAGLIVNGTLNVNGTSNNPVTFTRRGTSGNWKYIQFTSSGRGTINHANIQYAKKGIYSTSDNVTVKDCRIEYFTEQ